MYENLGTGVWLTRVVVSAMDNVLRLLISAGSISCGVWGFW